MSTTYAASKAVTPRPPRSAIQVVVVSDNLLSAALVQEKFVRSGLCVETRPTLESAMQIAGVPRPVAVWILSWPGEHALLDQAGACAQEMPLLVLGTGCPPPVQSQLLLAGARGYVDHSEGWDALQEAVAQVSAGGRRFSQEILCQSIDLLQRKTAAESQRPTLGLTPREKLIANMVVHGASNKDIAQQLNVSESTVKTHLQHIFAKVGVSSRLALVLLILKSFPEPSASEE